jgi:hypothetical protein
MGNMHYKPLNPVVEQTRVPGRVENPSVSAGDKDAHHSLDFCLGATGKILKRGLLQLKVKQTLLLLGRQNEPNMRAKDADLLC